jgi:hypothetical protein
MFNFADLARSGTAPSTVNASPKLKPGEGGSGGFVGGGGSLPFARVPVRPSTRGADSDLSELNVNLKMNKRYNIVGQLEVNTDYAQEDVGYAQAIESFQAAIDNWSDQRAQFTPSIGLTPSGSSSSTGGSSPVFKTNRSNDVRPPNRRSGTSGSAYTQDLSSAILSSQRPKAVKSASASGKDNNKLSSAESRQSRSQAVVAAYGSAMGASKPPSNPIPAKSVNRSGGARSASNTGSSGAMSKYVDPDCSDIQSEVVTSWATESSPFAQNSRPTKAEESSRRPKSTGDRRGQPSLYTASAADVASIKKSRKTAAPSPLLSATSSPSKPSAANNNNNGFNNGFKSFSEDEHIEDHSRRELIDISPGIYVDDTNGLDESYPDTSQFELLHVTESQMRAPPQNGSHYNNKPAAAHSSHAVKYNTASTMLPVDSDLSFGYPMGHDDLDSEVSPDRRPQSRKLYLGAQTGPAVNSAVSTISPVEDNNRRKLPQSAGIRSVTLYPDVSVGSLRRIPSLSNSIQLTGDGKGSNYPSSIASDSNSLDGEEEEVADDCVTVVATDTDCIDGTGSSSNTKNVTALNRPPSRQRSAFPVHLTDTADGVHSPSPAGPLSINSSINTVTREVRSSSLSKAALTGAGSSNTNTMSPVPQHLSGSVMATQGLTGPMMVATKPIKLMSSNNGTAGTSPPGGPAVISTTSANNASGNAYGRLDVDDDGEHQDVDELEKSISNASLSMQRPPSRQKIAAQNLFERNNPRNGKDGDSSGVENDLTGSSTRRNTARDGGHNGSSPERISDALMQDMGDIIAPATAAVPGRRNSNNNGSNSSVHKTSPFTSNILPSTAPVQGYRSGTAGGMVRNNDPMSDGFLDLDYVDADVPFQIIVNRASPAANKLGMSINSSPHPFSPFTEPTDEMYDTGYATTRSQTAPDPSSKLVPLISQGATSGNVRRSNNNGSNISSSNPGPAYVPNGVNNAIPSAASGSSAGSLRPGRRFLNGGNANSTSGAGSTNNWAGSGSSASAVSNPTTGSVRGSMSGGWMSATADTRTVTTQVQGRSVALSPSHQSMSMASLGMSTAGSQAQMYWENGDNGLDDDYLPEASQSFVEGLNAAPSLTLLSLESSLDEVSYERQMYLIRCL